jgi:cytochrome c5
MRALLVAAVAIAIGGCGRASSDATSNSANARSESASDAPSAAVVDARGDAASEPALGHASEPALDAAPSPLEAAFRAREDAGADASLDDAPLAGARWAPARAFVARYCAECHTEHGTNPRKKKALPQQRLDTYEQWRSHASVLRGVLDKWNPDGKTMPPKGARATPTDEERKAMLDWLARGSPNTVDGR